MFEKASEEYADEKCGKENRKTTGWVLTQDDFQKGAEFGYNKAMEEWKKCYLQCSSPFCFDKFSEVECRGVLGNMTKKESEEWQKNLNKKQ